MPAGRERIAVLALQRLGDVLTAARVTDALARRHSTATVELVHWNATTQAAVLLPGVTRRHELPFSGLRRRARAHPLAALRALAGHIDEIIGERGFDRVINLCSTRFSCWLSPALLAKDGRLHGPAMDDQGHYAPSHPAITYLNEWGVDPKLCTFVHQDLYAIAAGVRLSGWLGLPEAVADTTAAATSDQSAPRIASEPGSLPARDGPILVHPFGSERPKDWRQVSDWRQLVARLSAEFGRKCILLGAPSEAEALADIARGCDAAISTESLGNAVPLFRSALGLVSVDTVAIHLAAMTHCPAVVLRQGPARGFAFVSGPLALCVDAELDMPTVDEVIELVLRHFGGSTAPLETSTSWCQRLRVREGWRDPQGTLGLRTPSWCRADATWQLDDESDGRWAALWRQHFDGIAPSRMQLEVLAQGRGRDDALRWDTLVQMPGSLGSHARVCHRAHAKRSSAA